MYVCMYMFMKLQNGITDRHSRSHSDLRPTKIRLKKCTISLKS